MRILLLVNNLVGWQVTQWLKEQGEDIVGIVLHPPEKRKYGNEILRNVDLLYTRVFDGSQLRQPETIQTIQGLHPDIGLSIYFGYILRAEFINLFPSRIVNLHPAYLPYNRGAHPNIWSIVERTPAGVTLHYINEGVDQGDIITQRQVLIDPIDTGETLYHKLDIASVTLFKETWPLLRVGRVQRQPQHLNSGTTHRVCDVERIDEIDLSRNYTAKELIDLLRARTFPPYSGAFFRVNGRKVYLRLSLEYENNRD